MSGVVYQLNQATSDLQSEQSALLASIITVLQTISSQENDSGVITKLDTVIAALQGLATASNQATANASLAAIVTALSGISTAAGQVTSNASLASILAALNGIATAGNQTSGNATLASILAAFSPLASAANQVAGNASLASIDAKIGSSTSVRSTLAKSLTKQTVLAANVNRKGFSLFNNTTQNVYVAFGDNATASDFTVALASKSGYESSQTTVFRGLITAVWTSTSGAGELLITELT